MFGRKYGLFVWYRGDGGGERLVMGCYFFGQPDERKKKTRKGARIYRGKKKG